MTAKEVEEINSQASVLMKRGIELMQDARPDRITEALDCFDRARELRGGLPIDSNPALGYGLAACWLNRAEALIRAGEQSRISEAIQACDEGITLLRRLPLDADARYPRRLAVALQNRGLAQQMRDGPASEQALASLGDAIAVLELNASQAIPDRRFMLAAIWINVAIGWASREGAAAADAGREAASRSIELVRDLEKDDAGAAEAGLKARHVYCQILAKRLGLTAAAANAGVPEDVHEATDLVDDGLNLARHWEQNGVSRFRNIAYDLFRFGTRVYNRFQPQFLNEFVLDNLDAARSSQQYVDSPEMRSATEEAMRFVRLNAGLPADPGVAK